MYVKKFEGDSLDETLRLVKKELGPDAIILKTVTNKGIKGAFKKKRIEITAAISEDSLAKKANVDRILSPQQADQFYAQGSSRINNMINQYHERGSQGAGNGYGKIGLNKVVNTKSKISTNPSQELLREQGALEADFDSDFSLDDFLNNNGRNDSKAPFKVVDHDDDILEEKIQISREFGATKEIGSRGDAHSADLRAHVDSRVQASGESFELKKMLKTQENKIEILEKKLLDLSQNILFQKENSADADPYPVLKQVADSLRTLDINDAIVLAVVKKATYELSAEELKNEEIIYDFVLRFINEKINTQNPLFSHYEREQGPCITILLGESGVGQSSLSYKIAALQEGTEIISLDNGAKLVSDFKLIESLYKVKNSRAGTQQEIYGLLRDKSEGNSHLVVDINISSFGPDLDKFIQGIKRSYSNSEVLLTINAINSEIYNRKNISKYQELSDGLIITNVDRCPSFATLLNLHWRYRNLPMKLFGTGPIIPDDIESASAERILSEIFGLSGH